MVVKELSDGTQNYRREWNYGTEWRIVGGITELWARKENTAMNRELWETQGFVERNAELRDWTKNCARKCGIVG